MKENKGCLIGCLAVLACLGVVIVGPLFVIVPFCMSISDQIQGKCVPGDLDAGEDDIGFEKIWVSGKGSDDDPKILKVRITGEISSDSADIFGEEKSSAMSALRKIRAAVEDSDIRGLYLVLDTPGGEVTLSDIIADSLRRFKQKSPDRFVLVHMGSCCCSGGYYIAACADHIMAHPTTVTGSIGVIVSTLNAAGLAKKIGVESVVIATGTNKAMLDPFKPVEEEHLAIFRKIVDVSYARFLDIVSKGRDIPLADVRKIADGRILSAAEAKSLKLVDSIGYSKDAEAKLAELANSESVRIYRYLDEILLSDFFNGLCLSVKGMGRLLQEMASSRGNFMLDSVVK